MSDNASLITSITDENTSRSDTPESQIIDAIIRYGSQRMDYENCKKELIRIYYLPEGDSYRHRYGNISRCINEKQDGREYLIKACDDLQRLLQDELKKPIKKNKSEMKYLEKSLGKLRDHIDLELFREESDEAHSKSIRDFNNNADELTREFNEARRKFDGTEMGYIATLGLFSGIIMTFTGVISISDKALSNLSGTPIYKVVFILAVLGIILVNSIYAIFFWISKLLRRDVTAKCAVTDLENCNKCSRKRCGTISKWAHHHSALLAINVIFAILILVSIIMYGILT